MELARQYDESVFRTKEIKESFVVAVQKEFGSSIPTFVDIQTRIQKIDEEK